MTIPRATYRIQFHKDFTFADAEALVPYLADLGISHLYASPISVARSGSTHGYDVVDPTRISPDLGGEEGFRSLVAALRARGMGAIIDIVPNHMGIAGGENGWWQDVLAHGAASAFASFFDIDWREKIVLPVLGSSLDETIAAGDLAVAERDSRFALVAYGEHVFPLRDEDQAIAPSAAGGTLRALLDRQHYRLACWRVANDELNWRRFFTINDLAGLRVEDEAVFEATHALYFRLYREGLIDGVRIDHVDGLTDPAGYCRRLHARLDGIARPDDAPKGPAWIIVEKILGPGEVLAQDWGIDGTSGYDFMDMVSALLHDPKGEAPLADLWAAMSGRSARFEDEALRARQNMSSTQFRGQLGRCVEAFSALAASTNVDCPDDDLRKAIERLLWVFPVYRTYGDGTSAPPSDHAIRDEIRMRVARFVSPTDMGAVDHILAWLAGHGGGDPALASEAVRRFQQLSAPIAAKSVEDTAFYRYGRLLSRNDVGFDAAGFAMSTTDFHRAAADRAAHWPHAMLATATHDHKRGEDARARLAVLGDIPDLWRMRVDRWWHINLPHLDGIDRGDAYMLFQSIFGSFPEGLSDLPPSGLRDFAARIGQWQTKAVREARLRSSWEAPDETYESQLLALIDLLFDPRRSSIFLNDLVDFVRFGAPAARANMLVQTGLRCTIPGIPDLYQGAELVDLSLVDPDNRRPVDYVERQRLLRGGVAQAAGIADCEKITLIAELLDLRRRHEQLFAHGRYVPIAVSGPRAGHVLAFVREHGDERLLCAFVKGCGATLVGGSSTVPDAAFWGDTRLDVMGRDLSAADVFASQPVFVRHVNTLAKHRTHEPCE